MLIYTLADKNDLDLLNKLKYDVKIRLFLANKTDFMPFRKK